MDRINKGLLVIAAVLVAFSAFRLMQGGRQPVQLLDVPALVAADVVSLRFEGPDGVLGATRSAESWILTEPEAVRADSRKIEALLSDWAGGFGADLRVNENPDEEAEQLYGLDPEHRTSLRISGADSPLVDLHLGKSIAGGSHYLRAAGAKTVYRGRVPGSSRLKPALNLWEDRRLLPELSPDAVRIEVRGSHGPIVFHRSAENDDWQFDGEGEFTVANSKINALARSLGNFNARSILRGGNAEKERAGAALDSPRLTISVVDGSGRSSTIELGADHKDRGFLYASLLGDPRLFVLPQSILKNFDKDAAGLGGGV